MMGAACTVCGEPNCVASHDFARAALPDKLVVTQEAWRFADEFADSILCHPDFVAHAFQRAMNQAADAERERIGRWLVEGMDQACEDLCTAISAENRKQRAENIFVGQPYFDLFAAAIRLPPVVGEDGERGSSK